MQTNNEIDAVLAEVGTEILDTTVTEYTEERFYASLGSMVRDGHNIDRKHISVKEIPLDSRTAGAAQVEVTKWLATRGFEPTERWQRAILGTHTIRRFRKVVAK